MLDFGHTMEGRGGGQVDFVHIHEGQDDFVIVVEGLPFFILLSELHPPSPSIKQGHPY